MVKMKHVACANCGRRIRTDGHFDVCVSCAVEDSRVYLGATR